jgi:hypothetical protein
MFAGVTVNSACYLLGRTSYAVPADVRLEFCMRPYLLILMNTGTRVMCPLVGLV